MELAKRRVLVTGASSGLGAAFAEAFVAAGAEVYGTSRCPEKRDWPAGIKPVAFDLSDPDLVESQWSGSELEKAGIEVLVNNAGAGVLGAFEATDFEAWERQVKLMLLAPMKLARLALPRLRSADPEGVLVNVSSLAVEYPIPFMSGYNAAKAGLSAFSESLMLEQSGVRVIDFRPGDFRTAFDDNTERGTGGDSFERACRVIGDRLASAPRPEVAARRLVRALENGEEGTIRTGTIFQRFWAHLFTRMASGGLIRKVNRAYYKLDGDA